MERPEYSGNLSLAAFKKVHQFTRKWEGGYVNHPSDPGGATMYGVTQRVYDSYRDRKAFHQSAQNPLLSGMNLRRSVRLIERAEVEEIYFEQYWKASKAGSLPLALAAIHYDTAVNFGVTRAVKFLQKSVGALADGDWGPNTDKSVSAANLEQTIKNYIATRKAYRYERVKKAPKSIVFLKGWLNRDNALAKFSQELLS